MKITALFLCCLFFFITTGCAINHSNRISQLENEIASLKQDKLEDDIRKASESGAKWSTYASLGAGNIADGDDFMVRDISDTDPWSTGEQKLYTHANLKSDLSNFDEFGFPYGATMTWLNEKAEAGLDDTDDQLIVYGASERVFTYKQRFCFNTPQWADAGDDNVPVFSHEDGFTVTDMRCWTEGGTSVVITLSDGTNALDSMTCDADGTNDDGTIANATFTADEQMEFDTGTVTGAVEWCNFCFTYTITRE